MGDGDVFLSREDERVGELEAGYLELLEKLI